MGFGKLVRLNVSARGLSISAGIPGATLNYDLSGRRKHPVRATVGIPGTGVSYSHDLALPAAREGVHGFYHGLTHDPAEPQSMQSAVVQAPAEQQPAVQPPAVAAPTMDKSGWLWLIRAFRGMF
jgi:hypothetical protein